VDNDPLQSPVSAIMATRIEMVAETIPLSFAAKLMFDKHITGLPVTTELGELIGVISWRDVLAALNQPTHEAGFFEQQGLVTTATSPSALEKLEGTVADRMSRELVTVLDTATVGDAARKMAGDNVHRVLIVDDAGNLAGLVSAIDVVRHVVS